MSKTPVPKGTKKCGSCNGSGTVERSDDNGGTLYKNCTTCKGSGRVPKK